MKPSGPIWYPSAEQCYQVAHLLAGMVVIFGTEAMFPRYTKRCLLIFLAVMFVKEFWFDIVVELDTYASSLVDYVMYAWGAFMAYRLLMIFGRGGWLDKS